MNDEHEPPPEQALEAEAAEAQARYEERSSSVSVPITTAPVAVIFDGDRPDRHEEGVRERVMGILLQVAQAKQADEHFRRGLSSSELAAIVRLTRLARAYRVLGVHYQNLGLAADAQIALDRWARAAASYFALVDVVYEQTQDRAALLLTLALSGGKREGLEDHELARFLDVDVPREAGPTMAITLAAPPPVPTIVEKLVEHDPKGRISRVVETSTPVSS